MITQPRVKKAGDYTKRAGVSLQNSVLVVVETPSLSDLQCKCSRPVEDLDWIQDTKGKAVTDETFRTHVRKALAPINRMAVEFLDNVLYAPINRAPIEKIPALNPEKHLAEDIPYSQI